MEEGPRKIPVRIEDEESKKPEERVFSNAPVIKGANLHRLLELSKSLPKGPDNPSLENGPTGKPVSKVAFPMEPQQGTVERVAKNLGAAAAADMENIQAKERSYLRARNEVGNMLTSIRKSLEGLSFEEVDQRKWGFKIDTAQINMDGLDEDQKKELASYVEKLNKVEIPKFFPEKPKVPRVRKRKVLGEEWRKNEKKGDLNERKSYVDTIVKGQLDKLEDVISGKKKATRMLLKTTGGINIQTKLLSVADREKLELYIKEKKELILTKKRIVEDILGKKLKSKKNGFAEKIASEINEAKEKFDALYDEKFGKLKTAFESGAIDAQKQDESQSMLGDIANGYTAFIVSAEGKRSDKSVLARISEFYAELGSLDFDFAPVAVVGSGAAEAVPATPAQGAPEEEPLETRNEEALEKRIEELHLLIKDALDKHIDMGRGLEEIEKTNPVLGGYIKKELGLLEENIRRWHKEIKQGEISLAQAEDSLVIDLEDEVSEPGERQAGDAGPGTVVTEKLQLESDARLNRDRDRLDNSRRMLVENFVEKFKKYKAIGRGLGMKNDVFERIMEDYDDRDKGFRVYYRDDLDVFKKAANSLEAADGSLESGMDIFLEKEVSEITGQLQEGFSGYAVDADELADKFTGYLFADIAVEKRNGAEEPEFREVIVMEPAGMENEADMKGNESESFKTVEIKEGPLEDVEKFITVRRHVLDKLHPELKNWKTIDVARKMLDNFTHDNPSEDFSQGMISGDRILIDLESLHIFPLNPGEGKRIYLERYKGEEMSNEQWKDLPDAVRIEILSYGEDDFGGTVRELQSDLAGLSNIRVGTVWQKWREIKDSTYGVACDKFGMKVGLDALVGRYADVLDPDTVKPQPQESLRLWSGKVANLILKLKSGSRKR
ncbi:MAG: hypothetical protein UY41_C0002G0011 [Candidatus Moranbacteria bacterium GW2011_GWE1_49_15]|nr:MAG: hypothetical protein UX75_C0003G0010 [Candidatus Moranbacteria bacterium GW2011_GWE2_47_10]KKW07494.1 MAG: hypothetical protein UY41_C0002G0011 [Candidatus Moranbacteria bacterium GW2011_GWE1_49_15]HBP01272.1 hypothetical protein [Candidatus Moranbacteria bacterium]